MKPALLVLVSSAVASAVAVTAVHVVPPSIETPAAADTGNADLAAEQRDSIEKSLEAIASRLDRLEQQAQRASSREVAAPSPMTEPSPVEAASRGAKPPTGTARPNIDDNIDVPATVKKLREGKLTWEEEHAIWSKLSPEKQDELLRAMEEYAKGFPNSANAQNDLGEAYVHRLMNGDMTVMMTLGPKAEQQFTKTIKLDDHHWMGRFNLAMSLANQPDFLGRRPEAIGHFEVLMKQQEQITPNDKSHPATYLFLGNLYTQQGDAKKAQEIWNRGLKRFPTNQGLKGKLKK